MRQELRPEMRDITGEFKRAEAMPEAVMACATGDEKLVARAGEFSL